MKICYHASHEQFPPSELLTCIMAAEAAGFDAAMCSDHLHPWSERQGQSGFSFSWLGAALQATSLPIGTVTAPGQRYHPTMVAQAAATLWMSGIDFIQGNLVSAANQDLDFDFHQAVL